MGCTPAKQGLVVKVTRQPRTGQLRTPLTTVLTDRTPFTPTDAPLFLSKVTTAIAVAQQSQMWRSWGGRPPGVYLAALFLVTTAHVAWSQQNATYQYPLIKGSRASAQTTDGGLRLSHRARS